VRQPIHHDLGAALVLLVLGRLPVGSSEFRLEVDALAPLDLDALLRVDDPLALRRLFGGDPGLVVGDVAAVDPPAVGPLAALVPSRMRWRFAASSAATVAS